MPKELTIGEAASRAGRHPSTIRRWIRTGRLAATEGSDGRLVSDIELDRAAGERAGILLSRWRSTATGEPMPDVLALLRISRSSH